MAMSERGIWYRVSLCFLYTCLGAILGLFAGLAIAVLMAPEDDPSTPTAHEWFVLAIAFSAFLGAVGGGAVGLLAGVLAGEGSGWVTCGLGLLGMLIGVGIASLLPDVSAERAAYRSVMAGAAGAAVLIVASHPARG
jgi:hypothetical protein